MECFTCVHSIAGVVSQGWQADPNTRMVMPQKPGRWHCCPSSPKPPVLLTRCSPGTGPLSWSGSVRWHPQDVQLGNVFFHSWITCFSKFSSGNLLFPLYFGGCGGWIWTHPLTPHKFAVITPAHLARTMLFFRGLESSLSLQLYPSVPLSPPHRLTREPWGVDWWQTSVISEPWFPGIWRAHVLHGNTVNRLERGASLCVSGNQPGERCSMTWFWIQGALSL